MRALTVLLLLFVIFYYTHAAAVNSKLQTGLTPTNDEEGKPYIEEVTVESILQVLTPGQKGRQARTSTMTNLQEGIKVEARRYN